MKVLMGTLSKDVWQLASLVGNSNLTYGTEVWGGDLKNSHWKVFEKDIEIRMMSHVKVCSSTTYHIILAEFKELPIELYALKLTMGSQQPLG